MNGTFEAAIAARLDCSFPGHNIFRLRVYDRNQFAQ